MTITKMIELLKKTQEQYGDVDVYFDCSFCGKSTRPDILVPVPVSVAIKGDSEMKTGTIKPLKGEE